ncbi:MAG: hypothetical protein WC499_00435 [Patescibacteria group bacterium]
MNIAAEEIEKIYKILNVLEFSESEINNSVKKLGDLISTNIIVEALTEKGYKSKDGNFNYEEIDNFLKENYSEKEIKAITKKVTNDVTTDYFSKILKNISGDKLSIIENLLNSGSK